MINRPEFEALSLTSESASPIRLPPEEEAQKNGPLAVCHIDPQEKEIALRFFLTPNQPIQNGFKPLYELLNPNGGPSQRSLEEEFGKGLAKIFEALPVKQDRFFIWHSYNTLIPVKPDFFKRVVLELKSGQFSLLRLRELDFWPSGEIKSLEVILTLKN